MRIIKEHPTPAAPCTRAGAVILVYRPDSLHPYITGWRGDGDTGWHHGHYFFDLDDAKADYAARCKRGY